MNRLFVVRRRQKAKPLLFAGSDSKKGEAACPFLGKRQRNPKAGLVLRSKMRLCRIKVEILFLALTWKLSEKISCNPFELQMKHSELEGTSKNPDFCLRVKMKGKTILFSRIFRYFSA
jgi:hypothetical protein